MKKLALALVCLVSVAFFASCTPKGQPTISVLAEEGYATDGQNVILNTNIPFGFVLASSTETASELTKLYITVDSAKWAEIDLTGTSYTYRDTISFSLNREIIGTSVIKATVTDAKGQTASTSITLNIEKAPEVALVAKDFTWNRHGGNDATGLDEYGLEWKTNEKEIYAVITPKTGALLYRFEPAAWGNTITNAAKVALFSEATSITQFKEVSCTAANKDYDIVIGTVYNSEYHLIHVTHSKVSTFKGTDVTITGQSK